MIQETKVTISIASFGILSNFLDFSIKEIIPVQGIFYMGKRNIVALRMEITSNF